MSLKYFGTDGIRGAYGGEFLNDNIAYRAGVAAVTMARGHLDVDCPTVVAGRDTRASGEALYRSFAAGVRSAGGKPIDIGVAPTPCVAFASRSISAHLACSITASHNPAADNGLKFFQGSGVKLSEEQEQALDDAIDAAVANGSNGYNEPMANGHHEQVEAYLDSLQRRFSSGLLEGRRIAVDCAHGALHAIAPRLFESFGAKVVTVGVRPNGSNINADVGSEHTDSLKRLFGAESFDMGFAFDGDGDRVILFDESGRRIAGEATIAALALDAQQRGDLFESTLVTTVQSNLGLDAMLRDRGCRVVRTDVGDKHIVRLMAEKGFTVGGEESGHLVLRDFALTGDGLAAAARLAEMVARSGRCIGEWISEYAAFPHASKALKLASKAPLESCRHLRESIAHWESALEGDGRLLVRYSGTEPKLRLLVEARRKDLVAKAMEELCAAASKDLDIQ